jgi:hypothetical protein
MPGPNRHEERFSWHADVPTGNGRTLLAGLLHVAPNQLQAEPHTLALVLDTVHDFARQGLLRPSYDNHQAFYITHHGATLLDRGDADLPPGDPTRVARLESELAGLPDLDLIARHYAEAIAAYQAQLDYSATVMIGVCYEAGLMLLARAVVDYDQRASKGAPGMNKHHRKHAKSVLAGEYVRASAVEGLVYDVLCAVGTPLGADLEWVKTCLRPTCHFVRSLRNLAGHPTGKAIPRDDIAAHILLLPAFLRRLRSLRSTVATLL